MARVVLKNVWKRFSGVEAVKNVNLSCEDKEFIVLVGPSGCGKSTTLRLIAGLEDISEGEVHIGDRLVNDVPPKDRDIAMVFQNYALYPHMTVYENMAFGLRLKKLPKDEIDQRVMEAAEILNIKELLQRRPKELSGGQRQRVAVGRAIVRKPKVFLFDEPLSNLDAKLRVQMRAEIGKLHTRLQATMIYVTHDQVEAMTMGDRIVVMKDGYIQQIADPITLYDQPSNKFVAGFMGSPSMNFMEGSLIKKKDAAYFTEENFTVKVHDEHVSALEEYMGKDVLFGIRPEDIFDKVYASNASSDNTITATVEVVEPMGAEAYLYLTTGKSPFIARVDSYEQLEVNQDIDLVLDMSKAHFFDKATEQTII
ncbi:sn-glycerol-3-phosphate ABC transporter ATP-binding protein UgpC [bacterium]|nr:sn-glycerol-3-phosphate ABC transporter ATP-binding protein UgpC [bacterium]